MFRALTCPSSGGQIVLSQHLASSLSVNGCTVGRMRADCSTFLSSSLYGTQRIIDFSPTRVVFFHPEEDESSTRHPLVFLRYILILSSLQPTPLSFVYSLILEKNV
jgi:hypothetical protein